MALPVRDVSRQRRDTTERRRSRSGLRIDAGRGRRSPSFVGRRKTSVSRSNTSFWNGCSERERTGASPARYSFSAFVIFELPGSLFGRS
jgi:hypothetical protein